MLKEARRLPFHAEDMQRITQDPVLMGEFREIFRTEVNNPGLSELVLDSLEDFATDLERDAKVFDIKVELIDRAGIAVGVSVTAAAAGMVVLAGGAFGSALLLAGGIIGLLAAGGIRMKLKIDSLNCSVAAERISRLAISLKGHNP